MNVNYAAINFADILTSQGKYQEKQEVPFVPGKVATKVLKQQFLHIVSHLAEQMMSHISIILYSKIQSFE